MPAYAKGIRKIYDPPRWDMTLPETEAWAWSNGFKLFSYNGNIYVQSESSEVSYKYILSGLTVSDLEV